MSRNQWQTICGAAFLGLMAWQHSVHADQTVIVKPAIRTSNSASASVAVTQVSRRDPCRLPSHAHWNGQLGPGCYYLIPGPTCLRALCGQQYGWQPCCP